MKYGKKLLFCLFCLFSLTSCSIKISPYNGLPGEIISSLIIVAIGLILFFIVFLVARKTDPLKRPKGIMLVAEMCVEKMEAFVVENMGKRFRKFTPYALAVSFYIFMCFTIGLIGLPSPMTYYMVPFSLALCTFIMIHATSIHYEHWHYFKRYTSPFAIFLPINLLSMWAPLLSLSFRLLGNAISGWVLMDIVHSGTQLLSNAIAGSGSFDFIAPIVTPVLHAYFDIFSGYIQTLVFVMLTMLFISQEAPEEDEMVIEPVKKEKKKEKRKTKMV